MSNVTLKHNQDGIISIIVTMIVMLVVTLIVLGFARVMRREARQALDRQLSTQAFYAAESGINELSRTPGYVTSSYTTCAGGGPQGSLISGSNASFTCVLVDSAPDSKDYELVPIKGSKVVPIAAANGQQLKSITISWEDATSVGDIPSSSLATPGATPELPTTGNWTPVNNHTTGMIRLDLIPVKDDGSSITRSDIIAQTQSLFLYPSSAGDATYGFTPTPAAQGKAVGRCTGSGSKPCSLTITSLPSISGTNYKYFVRMRAMYSAVNVSISANNTSGAVVGLTGQISIDATGKAGDVLRRIQIRRDIGSFNGYTDYAIQSADDICKRLKVYANNDTRPEPGTNNPSSYPTACTAPFAQ